MRVVGRADIMPVGTDWRVARMTSHYAPQDMIGVADPEWTVIDFDPVEREAARPEIAVEREQLRHIVTDAVLDGGPYDATQDMVDDIVEAVLARLQPPEGAEK